MFVLFQPIFCVLICYNYVIFLQLWAKHRGKYDETSPPDYTKWKSNFRSVLGKSNDFEEVKEANMLDQQMGNYKVFRLKSSSEVKGVVCN